MSPTFDDESNRLIDLCDLFENFSVEKTNKAILFFS